MNRKTNFKLENYYFLHLYSNMHSPDFLLLVQFLYITNSFLDFVFGHQITSMFQLLLEIIITL